MTAYSRLAANAVLIALAAVVPRMFVVVSVVVEIVIAVTLLIARRHRAPGGDRAEGQEHAADPSAVDVLYSLL
jgi:hypothetical protein